MKVKHLKLYQISDGLNLPREVVSSVVFLTGVRVTDTQFVLGGIARGLMMDLLIPDPYDVDHGVPDQGTGCPPTNCGSANSGIIISWKGGMKEREQTNVIVYAWILKMHT